MEPSNSTKNKKASERGTARETDSHLGPAGFGKTTLKEKMMKVFAINSSPKGDRRHRMKNYTFIHDYKDVPLYRHSFNQLASETFGIDFEQWYLDGHWNDRYICYSYMYDNLLEANLRI